MANRDVLHRLVSSRLVSSDLVAQHSRSGLLYSLSAREIQFSETQRTREQWGSQISSSFMSCMLVVAVARLVITGVVPDERTTTATSRL